MTDFSKRILVCLLLLQGCSLMSMTRSNLRDTTPQSVQLLEQVLLTATGAINIYVFALVDHEDLFPASFKIESPRHTIYIDPILVDDTKKADYIFITHAHGDHLSLPDIDKLTGPQTIIICPAMVAKEIGARPHKLIAPGDVLDLDGIRVEGIGAYSTHTTFLGIASHPRSDKNTGYVLTVEGVRIFHAGDADLNSEMMDLKNIDAALLPIGSGDLTMSTQNAARLVNAIKPRIVVPMHYSLSKDKVETFRALVDPGIEVKVLQLKNGGPPSSSLMKTPSSTIAWKCGLTRTSLMRTLSRGGLSRGDWHT